MVASPYEQPVLRDDLPRFPWPLQLLKVGTATVPGPFGYASSSALAPLLYVGATQQLRTDTLLPRDREPCLVQDMNGMGLQSGYYLGRLATNYSSLPVYETCAVNLLGLSADQVRDLVTNLTPDQIAKLNNLSACQMAVFTQLNPSQKRALASSLTPTQLASLVDQLTFTQLSSLATSSTPAQLLGLTSAAPALYQNLVQSLTQPQLTTLAGALTGGQISTLTFLTPTQLQVLLQLRVPQLQFLTANLTAAQMSTLLGTLTFPQLYDLVVSLTAVQLRQLTFALTAAQLSSMAQALTGAQIGTLVSNLQPSQLVALAKYPPDLLGGIVPALTTAQLPTLLGRGTPPAPVLGNQNVFPGVPALTGQPSATPLTFQGYAPVAINATTAQLYGYVNGAWQSLSGGGGGGGTINISDGVRSETGVSTIVLDGAAGLQTPGGAATPNVTIIAATATQAGIVDTNSSQVFAGGKTFNATLKVGNPLLFGTMYLRGNSFVGADAGAGPASTSSYPVAIMPEVSNVGNGGQYGGLEITYIGASDKLRVAACATTTGTASFAVRAASGGYYDIALADGAAAAVRVSDTKVSNSGTPGTGFTSLLLSDGPSNKLAEQTFGSLLDAVGGIGGAGTTYGG